MKLESWLPIGYKLPESIVIKNLWQGEDTWQIYDVYKNGKVLVVKDDLAQKWIDLELIEEPAFKVVNFSSEKLYVIHNSSKWTLCPAMKCNSPTSKSEAMAFALALKKTREIDPESNLHDAIYTEKYTRLLPTYSLTESVNDDVILGAFLTGGVHISATSFRRIKNLVGWLNEIQLKEVIDGGGVHISKQTDKPRRSSESIHNQIKFLLPGRKDLENFIQEHIIDIIENKERYAKLGIDFPSALVLYGPPGCGKTYAVDRLLEYIDWPSYEIDCSSIGSPYIHETGRKIAEVFETAIKNAPSVIIIDEMEAFLADRGGSAGAGHHRIEEVGEFLRRIPDAIKNQVLVIAMTNKIDMIDKAILRRGRFDHVIEVGMPSHEEIENALYNLLKNIPHEQNCDMLMMSKRLEGSPLSDVAFVVKEGARIAAKTGRARVDGDSLNAAVDLIVGDKRHKNDSKKIGFT